eukprot:s7405_g1.t1
MEMTDQSRMSHATGMSIWRIVDRLVLHIFGMVAGIKVMPMTLILNKEVMSSRVFGAASYQISDRFCYAGIVKTTSSQFSQGQRQSAKGKMIPMMGKNGGKGKGKIISKGYQSVFFKGAFGKGFFNDKASAREVTLAKLRLGKFATDIDARQSANGLKVADESFPGELGCALARLEPMKLGRHFWKRGGKRRLIRVLVHCYGGINRTCAAYCALVMAFASMSMEKAIAKWIKHRAYYAPFLDREYMIEALLELQDELHTYRR